MRVNSLISRIPRRWQAAFWSLLIGTAAAGVARLAPRSIAPLRQQIASLDRSAYNWLFDHRGTEGEIPEVAIVQIDKNAITNMMDVWHESYPFPRAVHARLIRNLKRAGARVVGMDILFDTLKDDPAGQASDRDFAAALRESGNVVLGADFISSDPSQTDQGASSHDFPASLFRDAALGYGPVNLPQDDGDGWVRRFELALPHLSLTNFTRDEDYPHFAVRVAGAYRNIPQAELVRQIKTRHFGGGSAPVRPIPPSADYWESYRMGDPSVPKKPASARICFVNRPKKSCEFIEYDQAYAANSSPASMDQLHKLVNNLIVLVGSTEESEHDNFDTPVQEQGDRKRPGVEIQASIIHTLLAGHYYATVPDWIRKAILLFATIITTLITLFLRPTRGLGAAVVILSAALGVDIFLFDHRWFMRPTEILLLGIPLAYLGETVFLYLTEERRAREARRHFGRYVGPKVLEKVLDSGHHVALEGEIRHVSIMFTDVQGFTSLSEKMAPADAVAVLNKYLTKMVDCIFKYEGTLDKVMGDGIMAYFGAPNTLPNPELSSVQCAIEMQRIMQEWRRDSETSGLPPLKKRIGIHCGEVIVGEVGSANQVGFTLIGDAVNVAARLEPLNKEYSTEILISDQVKQHLPDSIELDYRGEVPIRGRKEAIHAYSVQVPPVVPVYPDPAMAVTARG